MMLQGLWKSTLFALLYACLTRYSRSTLCSAAQQHIQRESWSTSFLSVEFFFQNQALKSSTKEKPKHFKSMGDEEHAGAHYKAHIPCSRNMTFQSLNLFSSDTLQSSRICTHFLCTYIKRNTQHSSGSGILLVAAAWYTSQILFMSSWLQLLKFLLKLPQVSHTLVREVYNILIYLEKHLEILFFPVKSQKYINKFIHVFIYKSI